MLRIASVSFLNAKPLIYGLQRHASVKLILDVPARLLEIMQRDEADIALLPVIDFQRWDKLKIVPAGAIGSNGATHTVRIFSRKPIDSIETLSCDVDSHTSVALSRIILGEVYSRRPRFLPSTDRDAHRCDAKLLIGDKVVLSPPTDHPHQLDLGEAWKKLTGLPFVFAVWMMRDGAGDAAEAFTILNSARLEGCRHVDDILATSSAATGWPIELARAYLTRILSFDFGQIEQKAIAQFFTLAVKYGVLANARPLQFATKGNPT